MELGPLPYPRKRTAPTVSRSPKAASGAAAIHGVLYHRSGVFFVTRGNMRKKGSKGLIRRELALGPEVAAQ